MGDILSAAIVLLVFVGLYVAVSYMYKKKSLSSGCCGDCSQCGTHSKCNKEQKNDKL